MFGISDSSGPTRRVLQKILPCCSDKLVRGEFSVAKTSCTCYQGTFKPLSELRTEILRLSLNTPCLSYLSSLVKKVVLQAAIDLTAPLTIMQSK